MLCVIVLIDEIRSPGLPRSSGLIAVEVIGGIRDQRHGLVRMVGVVNENLEVTLKSAQIAPVSAHVVADGHDLMVTRVAISLQAERNRDSPINERAQFLDPSTVTRLQAPVEKFIVPCTARVEADLRPLVQVVFD